MASEGRGGPVTLAALVGALAGFAFSPIPFLFDAEWLSWTLVPVFAAVGAVIAFIHPELGRPVIIPAEATVTVGAGKLRWALLIAFLILAVFIIGRDLKVF